MVKGLPYLIVILEWAMFSYGSPVHGGGIRGEGLRLRLGCWGFGGRLGV